MNKLLFWRKSDKYYTVKRSKEVKLYFQLMKSAQSNRLRGQVVSSDLCLEQARCIWSIMKEEEQEYVDTIIYDIV